jgi:hypothetical protein
MSFFSIYTSVFFTLYTISISHEFKILHNKIDHLTQETKELKNLYYSQIPLNKNKNKDEDDTLLNKFKI